jgi:putative phosphoesterase
MKIGVMGDSHGNVDYVRQVAECMMEAGVEYIVHLGDDYYDAHVLDILPVNVIKVPGAYDDAYQHTSVPNRVVEDIVGLKVLISHTRDSHPNDLPQDEKPEEYMASREVDVVLFGHGHYFYSSLEDGILMVSPGHLKVEDKRGEATFAILDINDRNVEVQILNMIEEVRFQESFQL